MQRAHGHPQNALTGHLLEKVKYPLPLKSPNVHIQPYATKRSELYDVQPRWRPDLSHQPYRQAVVFPVF